MNRNTLLASILDKAFKGELMIKVILDTNVLIAGLDGKDADKEGSK